MNAENLEQRVNKLEHELERVKAVNEIMNLAGRMQWEHTANHTREIEKFFTHKAKDVRIYWGGSGYWEGPKEISKPGKTFPEHNPGHVPLHFMANPVIEVAKDGKTAKAVFVASGIVAMKDRKTKKPTAFWEFNRYGCDFIKEGGVWKIWHWHVFDLFGAGWNANWEDQFKPREGGGMSLPKELKQTYPATPLDKGYNPDEELTYIPYPEPYETFDPKSIY